MRLTYLPLVTLTALFASAKPAEYWGDASCGGGNVTNQQDIDNLNFALALANLQNAFYKQNLGNLNQGAFNASGFGGDVRNNFDQISQNHQAQVNLLAQTLGACATPYCSYDFHVTNATNFTATAQVIEDIGTSAYVGSIGNLTNSTLQIWAASILSSNARAASYAAFVNGQSPVSGPFDPPLTPQEVTTLTSPYIVSCPPNSTNPFHPGQNLAIVQESNNQAHFVFSNASTVPGQQLFAVYHQGLGKTIVPLDSNNVAVIPANTSGITFAEITNSSTEADDENIVAGPSYLIIPVANGSNGTVPVEGPTTTFESSSATGAPTSSSSAAPPSSSSVQSTVVVTTTSSQQSTVVVTTTSQQSTVVVTATSSA
ncbi:hypothetical protein C0991_012254 [Blastosporella zonata]|nr:hypothetical protein C0991_012254 [Blastosporella zonata]